MSAAGWQNAGRPRSLDKSSSGHTINHVHCEGPMLPAWWSGRLTSARSDSPSRALVVAHARRKWYAVFEPAAARGIYRVWDQVKRLVSGQPNAVHKGFANEAAALAWISHLSKQAKQESDALYHLRLMILGPEGRTGQAAALELPASRPLAGTCSRSPGSSTAIVQSSASSATRSSMQDTATTAAVWPRPWETESLVLPLPSAPSHEYYKKWYAVRFVDGGSPGIYNTWQDAERAISGRYAEHRSFESQVDAIAYAFGPAYVDQLLPAAGSNSQQRPQQQQERPLERYDAMEDAADPDGYLDDGTRLDSADWRHDLASSAPTPDLPQWPGSDEVSSGAHHHQGHQQGGDQRSACSTAALVADLADRRVALGSQVQPAGGAHGRVAAFEAVDAASTQLWPVTPGDTLHVAGWLPGWPEAPSGGFGTGTAGARVGQRAVADGGGGDFGGPLPAAPAMMMPTSSDVLHGSIAPTMVPTAAAAAGRRQGESRLSTSTLGPTSSSPLPATHSLLSPALFAPRSAVHRSVVRNMHPGMCSQATGAGAGPAARCGSRGPVGPTCSNRARGDATVAAAAARASGAGLSTANGNGAIIASALDLGSGHDPAPVGIPGTGAEPDPSGRDGEHQRQAQGEERAQRQGAAAVRTLEAAGFSTPGGQWPAALHDDVLEGSSTSSSAFPGVKMQIALAKRGRGRPPKSTTAQGSFAPGQQHDELVRPADGEAVAVAGQVQRRRGPPRKPAAVPVEVGDQPVEPTRLPPGRPSKLSQLAATAAGKTSHGPEPSKRPRGRPGKELNPASAVAVPSAAAGAQAARVPARKRGRPPKAAGMGSAQAPPPEATRPRGRPPKIVVKAVSSGRRRSKTSGEALAEIDGVPFSPIETDREALGSLVARAPEMRDTVCRVMDEWVPQLTGEGLFQLQQAAECELWTLRDYEVVTTTLADTLFPAEGGPVIARQGRSGGLPLAILQSLYRTTGCAGKTSEHAAGRALALVLLLRELRRRSLYQAPLVDDPQADDSAADDSARRV